MAVSFKGATVAKQKIRTYANSPDRAKGGS